MSSENVDTAGLTRAQRKRLELVLDRERSATIGALGSAEGTPRSGGDAIELASDQGHGSLLVARMRAHLRDIDQALAKMRAGTYGFSERSGCPIGYRRLEAIPWARFTLDEIQAWNSGSLLRSS